MSRAKGKDVFGSKMGMWLFLFTEIIFFGGLFVLYAVYSNRYHADFVAGGDILDTVLGTTNTVILLVSSFFVAAALTALQRGRATATLCWLGGTILFAALFLVNKYFEWTHKFHDGIYPGSERLAEGPPGQNIFFGLYYVITGLHGLHVAVGIVLLALIGRLVWKKRLNQDDYVALENGALYWHLVDLIWIFIFPLFYLLI